MFTKSPPEYIFCPKCTTPLVKRRVDERIRQCCPNCQFVYFPHMATSAAAVIIKNERVLMVKRDRLPFRGTWMFPSGFVEYGEHPEETIKREVKEETGLQVTHTTFLEVVQSTDDPREPNHLLFFYQASVEDGELINQPEENEAVAWIRLEERPEIGWMTHKQMFQRLISASLH